jgi:CSLREA domain-containing protein
MRQRAVALAGSALLVGLVALLWALPAARAATTWVVNDTGDAGPGNCSTTCTLRDAIAAAQDGDTVQLTNGATYMLDQTKGELVVSKSITIAPASGSASVEFSSTPTNSRVFEIAGVSGTSVSISGLTITRGQVTSTATDPCGGYVEGGGICVDPGNTLDLINSTVTLNSVSGSGPVHGGGIASYGTLNLTNTTVSDNTLTSSTSIADGGGLYLHAGTNTIAGSHVNLNTVTAASDSATCNASAGGGCEADGGGIDLDTTGVVDLTGGSTVNGNTVTGGNSTTGSSNGAGSAHGGGIADNASSGTTTIDDATVSSNTATGGADSGGGSGGGAGAGGGIYNGNTGTIAIQDGTVIDSNSARGGDGAATSLGANEGRGGGVDNEFTGTVNLTNSTVSNNNATGGASALMGTAPGFGTGGGIDERSAGGTFTVTGSTISGNIATGGANTAAGTGGTAQGGGVYSNTPMSLTNTTIVSNSAEGGSGGSVGSGKGGGLLNNAVQNVSISSVTFNQNTATSQGGSILTTFGQTSVRNTIIAGGSAPDGSNCKNIGGTFTDQGHNIDDGTSCGLSGSGDLSSTNPMLGQLQNNGGQTSTEALPATSPAVDAGDVAANCPATDQRGRTRPDHSESTCDIGAYEYQEDTLTVATAGSGSGTVTSSPAGISCPGTCTHTFTDGSMVTLTATAAAGSTFAGWSGGGCSGTGTCQVTMSSDQSVTATFTSNPPPQATLTVERISTGGNGTVTSSPAGISCPSACSHGYAQGTRITLTATVTSGSFGGWSGGGCSGTTTCTVTLNSDMTVTALFRGPGKHTTPPALCTITPSASVAVARDTASTARKHKHRKPKKAVGVLTVVVRCNQSATVRVGGVVTLYVKSKKPRKHHRSSFIVIQLRSVSATVKAGVGKRLTLKLPKAALAGLRHKHREAVEFVLTATNANGKSFATKTIRALKPTH